jgi:hypothetical protein
MKANKNLISAFLGVALLAMPITAAAGAPEHTGDRLIVPALAQTYATRVNPRTNLMLIHDRDDWGRHHRWRDRDDWRWHDRDGWRWRNSWRNRYYAPVYRDDDCRVGRRYYPYRYGYWQRDF